MTVNELYEWAVKNQCENLPLRIWWCSETDTYIEPNISVDKKYVDI